MSYKLKGVLYKVFPTEQKTDKFSSREFVIQTDGDYPQLIKFQLVQNKCSIIEDIAEGEVIEVSFDLRGREWNEKYFTNLNAWKVESIANNHPFPTAKVEGKGVAQSSKHNVDDDDLPF